MATIFHSRPIVHVVRKLQGAINLRMKDGEHTNVKDHKILSKPQIGKTCKTTDSRSFAKMPPITWKVVLGSSKVSPEMVFFPEIEIEKINQVLAQPGCH